MTVTLADAVAAYRTALVTAVTTAVADTSVQIVRGNPGPNQADDIISVGVPRGQLVTATITTLRTSDVELSCSVIFSIFRRGDQSVEDTVTTRAFDLLSKVEKYIRVDNITLGGIVRKCQCATFGDQLGEPVGVAEGRLIEFPAVFTAIVRLSN